MTDPKNQYAGGIRVVAYVYLALLMLGLTACHEDSHEKTPHLISGTLRYQTQNGSSIEKEISKDQLQKLDTWLNKYRDKWGGCYITPPQHRFLISLKYTNGQAGYLRLLKFDNSNSTLMATRLAGSNKSDQTCAFLTVSDQEISNLRAILALENTP